MGDFRSNNKSWSLYVFAEFYLVREGFQKISIRLVLDCRYALSAESGSLTVQVSFLSSVTNRVPLLSVNDSRRQNII